MSIGDFHQLKRIADALERIAKALENPRTPTWQPMPTVPNGPWGPGPYWDPNKIVAQAGDSNG